MNKVLKKIIIFLFFISCSGPLTEDKSTQTQLTTFAAAFLLSESSYNTPTTSAKLQSLQAEKNALSEQVDELLNTQKENKSLSEQIAQAKKNIDELNKKLTQHQKDKSNENNRKIDELNTLIKQYMHTIEQQKTELTTQARKHQDKLSQTHQLIENYEEQLENNKLIINKFKERIAALETGKQQMKIQ